MIRFGVLIVDKDRSFGRDIAGFFRAQGCQAFVAGNPKEAIDTFNRQNIRLVITSFELPEFPPDVEDGIGLIRVLKAAAKKKRWWIHRAFAGLGVHFVLMEASRVRGVTAEGEGIWFLKKPVERKELELLVKQLGILKILSKK